MPAGNSWILWWRISQDELDRQVAEYDSLGWFQSARKLSALLLLLSATLSVGMIVTGLAPRIDYVDVALLSSLSAFIYFRHRWAMIAAMILWTIEKIVIAIVGTGIIKANALSIIMSFFWWTAFMHAFYLAFRVEQQRRSQGTTELSAFD